MRKRHHVSLKFHTGYTLVLAIIFVAVIIFKPDIALAGSMVFLILYIVGNGIIHSRKNVLSRDTIVEYCIVSAIALVVLIGAIL